MLSLFFLYGRQQHDSSVVLAVSQVFCLRQLDDKAFFPVPRKFILFQDLLKEAVDLLSHPMQRCFYRRWSVQQFTEVLAPSVGLFRDRGERLSLFVLDWLVCLLVSSSQLPGDVVQAFHVSLRCGFFCPSCQVVNVASLARSYASLYLSVGLAVRFPSLCLCCSGPTVIQNCLLFLSGLYLP